MRLVAVVLGYWENRFENVGRIVDDLQHGTRPPDHTIVLLQGKAARILAWPWDSDDDLTVIRTGGNFHTRAKFVTALLDFADAYLLMDDDTSVGPKTVECLEGWAIKRRSRFVTGYWGVTLNGTSFMKGNNWIPQLVDQPVNVDAFHGRAIFATRESLIDMLRAEGQVRVGDTGEIDWPHEGDDLIIGLANPGDSWIVPMRGDEAFVDLDQCGEALQFGEGYFDMRDRFSADAVKRLGAK